MIYLRFLLVAVFVCFFLVGYNMVMTTSYIRPEAARRFRGLYALWLSDYDFVDARGAHYRRRYYASIAALFVVLALIAIEISNIA